MHPRGLLLCSIVYPDFKQHVLLLWTSIALSPGRFNDVSVVFHAEAVFFGHNFSSKAKPSHLSQHDEAWQTAKIALISTVLWVPVGICTILVSWRTLHALL